jgi:hypothetical protein
MVVVDMSPMALKVIGKEACLWARGHFRLSKDPKKAPKHLKEGNSKKKKKNFMKVEEGGVHCNIYDGYCMKQWVRIPKVT